MRDELILHLNDARMVLEGRHGFQYQLPSQIQLCEQLASVVKNETPEKLIMVNGTLGSGITYCLESVAKAHSREVVVLNGDIYEVKIPMRDRLMRTLSLTPPDSYKGSLPRWFIEFIEVAGITTVVVDDVDRLFSSQGDYAVLIDDMGWIASSRLNVIFSTHHPRLIQSFVKRNSLIDHTIFHAGNLSVEQVLSIGESFFSWNNKQLQRDLNPQGLKLDTECGLQIREVISHLEVEYAKKIIQECMPELCAFNSEISTEEMRYALAKITLT